MRRDELMRSEEGRLWGCRRREIVITEGWGAGETKGDGRREAKGRRTRRGESM